MDEATLRKAVGLAGSNFYTHESNDGRVTFLFVADPDWYEDRCWNIKKVPQYVLDALAMQLARQVDALPDYDLVSRADWAEVRSLLIKGLCGDPAVIAGHTGPNRVENIINAAVDSGVLDKDTSNSSDMLSSSRIREQP